MWKDSAGGQGFSGMGFIIKKIVVHRKPTPVREGENLEENAEKKIPSKKSSDLERGNRKDSNLLSKFGIAFSVLLQNLHLSLEINCEFAIR